MVMTTKKNLIKTVLKFTLVKDIDTDYIYTHVDFNEPQLECGYVTEIFINGTVKLSQTTYLDCECCSYSEDVFVNLDDLTEDSLRRLIIDLEGLLL